MSAVSWKHRCDCHFELHFVFKFGKVISLLKYCWWIYCDLSSNSHHLLHPYVHACIVCYSSGLQPRWTIPAVVTQGCCLLVMSLNRAWTKKRLEVLCCQDPSCIWEVLRQLCLAWWMWVGKDGENWVKKSECIEGKAESRDEKWWQGLLNRRQRGGWDWSLDLKARIRNKGEKLGRQGNGQEAESEVDRGWVGRQSRKMSKRLTGYWD